MTIPVDFIGYQKNTFYGCPIATIHYTAGATGIMPDRNLDIESELYYQNMLDYYSSLTTVIFDEGITCIGDYAFYTPINNRYGKLNNIRFPVTLISIGDYAFGYQKSLYSILFHGDQVTISSSAFINCPTNITIYGQDHGEMYDYAVLKNYGFVVIDKPVIEEGNYFTATGLQLEFHATVCSDIATYVTNVDWEVQNQTSTSTLISSDGILKVGDDETSEVIEVIAKWKDKKDSVNVEVAILSGLNSFTLPENLIHIEEEAFQGIPVEVLYIPQSCTEIDSRVFTDCQSLRYVIVYDKDAIDIENDAFSDVIIIERGS